MAKCPECGKTIDSLTAIVDERNTYHFTGDGVYSDADRIDFEVDIFKCPECHQELPFNDESDAIAFLEN